MKTILPILLSILLLIISGGCTMDNLSGKPTSYYVSNEGNDDFPGTMEQPFKTIEKANSLDLDPGDSLLFMANQTFHGTLLFDSLDSGDEQLNVVISSYGEGRAIIDGVNFFALRADHCSSLSVRDLNFKGDGRKNGNTEDGVFISNGDNVYVDQVEVTGFQHSGLRLHICDNSKITNVYAHDNGFAGIHVTGTTMNDPINYDNQNLYIGYCVAENNPGDPTVLRGHSGNGILAHSVEGGIIEYCESFNNGWDMPWNGNGPVGIWIWDCTDFMIQYCISHDNKTHLGARDGGGFDFDGGTSNSIMQYNIAFNNEGSGIGLYEFGATKPWENNTIRYNLSINDAKSHDSSLGIWKGENGTMRTCEIYNNTFFNNNPNGSCVWIYNHWPGFNFRNNVFIYRGSFVHPGQKIETERFQGNCYWNLEGKTEIQGYPNLDEWAIATGNEIIDNLFRGLFVNPELQNPGSISLTNPRLINPENLSGYMPGPGSPLIDKGLNLKERFDLDPGLKDIAGTSIPSGTGFDIGALESIHK